VRLLTLRGTLVILSGATSRSLSSSDPQSSDNDDCDIARQNRKSLRGIGRYHDYSLGLDNMDNMTTHYFIRGGENDDRDRVNASDDSGCHSVYNDTDNDDKTPNNSEENEFTVRVRRKKKVNIYNPSCDHKEFDFCIGMMFDNGAQFKQVV